MTHIFSILQVWCAAGVDLTGGRCDVGNTNISSIGSSLFYVSSPEGTDEVAKLNNELKVSHLSFPSHLAAE